jgi:ribosomal protein S12 methylthiotransferase
VTKSLDNSDPIRVGLVSLGCAKNLVDAEVMLGSLIKDGFEITNNAANADVVIVNTCSFIDSAQEESVDAILESDALRRARNPGQGLIVSGCLPQRFRAELPKLLPEVDAFIGIDQVAQISEIVRKALSRRAARIQKESDSSPPHEPPPLPSCGHPLPLRGGEGTGEGDLQGFYGRIPSANSLPARNERGEDRGEGQLNGEGSPLPSSLLPWQGRKRETSFSFRGGSKRSIHAPASVDPLVAIQPRPRYIPDYATPRFRLTPRHFAYVKIAEGCNHPCSFCTIPRMRGSHRSRPQSDIVEEARRLVAEGVKELNLISQDSTFYGLDLRRNRNGSIAAPENFKAAARTLPVGAATLCTLLRALNDLPGEFWIRLLYTHPAHWTDELIRTIAECPKVARYVDMPLQHIHDNMLERMRRETSQQYIRDLIARIRTGVPGIALRTTFIVGFPGETEAYFETLLDFIRGTKFERLGVFAYSKEEGTLAARMMSQVPDRVKKQRRRRAMAEQLRVARAVSQSFVGRAIKVLIERKATDADLQKANVCSWEHGLLRRGPSARESLKGSYLIARGEADAPDIDGRVYVRGRLPLGEFAAVRVVDHSDYDVIARPV